MDNQLLEHYVSSFNADDEETIVNKIPNSRALSWMKENVPFLLIPDKEIEKSYYFRFWSYRKHIVETPEGHVVTEFNVKKPLSWAGPYNGISCAAGAHVEEGRWLKNREFLYDYCKYWYFGGGKLLSYGNWFEYALCRMLAQHKEKDLAEQLFPHIVESYLQRERAQLHKSGLYWSDDDRDGMEFSVGGTGLRPTVSSYMYGAAIEIRNLAAYLEKTDYVQMFSARAADLYKKINSVLWDESARFYKTQYMPSVSDEAPQTKDAVHDAREICGFFPWKFHAAAEGRSDAFLELLDPDGFFGAHGLTTCERRNPWYRVTTDQQVFRQWLQDRGEPLYVSNPGKACLWNGPCWPFPVSCALSAAATLLQDYKPQDHFTSADFHRLLHIYAAAHRRTLPDGREVCWIDEDLHPDTGAWLVREQFEKWYAEGLIDEDKLNRGKEYNHSTFCDLVISGLFGVRADWESVQITPLFPSDWQYALLEDVPIGNDRFSIYYGDCAKNGKFEIYKNGELVFQSDRLQPYSYRQSQ